jgi:hypothetical protein
VNERQTGERVLGALNIVLAGMSVIILYRVIAGPDAFTRVYMRVLRTVSNTAKSQADNWSTIAAKCDTQYHRVSM